MECKCGCGSPISSRRKFINKEHQLDWMRAGGAREIGALQPPEAKALGGQIAGKAAAESGRLAAASLLGGARAREIAEQWREKNLDDTND